MGGGLQVEKRLRRRSGLTSLFWRYLLTTGGAVLVLAVLWWGGMTVLMRMGVVYPANTAAVGVGAVMESLSAGELDTADIPYYYRWALFDSGGPGGGPREYG